MQAAFTLPRPMLPNTTASTRPVEPAACNGVDVQLASAKPGAVAPGTEGPHNLLPHTGQHAAGLCDQAVANRAARASASAQGKGLLAFPFPRACVQYRCVECSCSVDVAHNFSGCMPQEHRTGDGSYVPCSGTLLPYAMPKLLHDATSFDLLPPGVELDKTTLRADVAYCVRVDELTNTNISCNRQQRVVEGTWLGAELLAWGGPVDNTMHRDEVRVFKAGVDPHTPSDGTQPTMPDKEQPWLEALRAAGECWLQALRAAGLALCAWQDAALAQASRQALLQDLRSAGSAVILRLYQHAARVAAE